MKIDMPHKTRLAIIGYGRFGRVHAMRARTHPAFELACIVDPSPQARQAAQTAGFMAVPRLRDMPRGVDAATVVTPYDTHADIAITLMRMGIDVLVEKPFASSERDIDAMLDTQAVTRRTLCTGHLERFNQQLITAPWTAPPQSIAFNRCSSLSVGLSSAVLDLMVHDLDTASLLFAHEQHATFEVIEVRQHDHVVNAHVLFCGMQLSLSACHGAPKSDARLFWQSLEERNELCLNQPCSPGHIDSLTRQYTAFHERLHDRPSLRPIASSAEGATAARRALVIESWL
ncbi:Gfo/Idh/MocA family oxidoreductase [Diaphorobacter sp. HDW4B]|uniref:Gfo/Idh/MocA family protein n=1 Tax=Diaphorobacter sp. HDW4B TaxID=2714925 RepID=UPI00140BB430|nr:Gfo/Idh/MocA family oxidoreductase [Diaphorobacter sp. HDW4B]QIL69779.1 Gfo/Idh/MocA family oxidoreductase [Diaphorobacter sp. HDW4B]